MTFRFSFLSALGAAFLASAAMTGAAVACPSYNNPTVFGSASLNANFYPDPWVRQLTAGGTIDLANCSGGHWTGYVITRPDFRLFYNGTSPTGTLTFGLEALSNVDTVLLINAPDGSWHFNDDNGEPGDTDSMLVFTNPLTGQYDVWTGSYSRSSNNPARLIVTELDY